MSRRISIDVPGLDHLNPVPSASRIGPFLVTSGVSGRDPLNGKFPETLDEQCAQMFASLRKILEIGGASPEDVLKITVWLKDRSQRAHVNKHWVAMFPDPHSRPARHTFANPLLDPPMLVQCDCFAVIAQPRGKQAEGLFHTVALRGCAANGSGNIEGVLLL